MVAGFNGIRRGRTTLVVILAAWVLAVPLCGVAAGAGGDLDATFGGDGKVTTALPGWSCANAVAIQVDGKIVAAGTAGASEDGGFAVVRYLADGALDDTFGSGGVVTTPIGTEGGAEARAVAMQADGKIVVGGTVDRLAFAVVRYTPDGSLDPTFGGGDGVVRTNVTRGSDSGYAAAIQPNGKILLAGSAGPRWHPRFAIVRYGSDGTLDARFGDGGVVLTRFGVWGVARAIALQPDGRIVLAGMNGETFALARYLRNGRLDPTFGGDGKATGATYGGAFTVALQPDGRIVAAGAYDYFRFAVERYRPNGALDPTFGDDGQVTTDVGGSEQGVIGLAIQPDRRIVAIGHAGPHETGGTEVWRFALARFTPRGALDTTFGSEGIVTTGFDGGAWSAASAVQSDGRIVAAGGYGEANGQGFALARYLTG